MGSPAGQVVRQAAPAPPDQDEHATAGLTLGSSAPDVRTALGGTGASCRPTPDDGRQAGAAPPPPPGAQRPRPAAVVGLALKKEKRKKHISDRLVALAAEAGIELRFVDKEAPLEAQGPFAAILQKVRKPGEAPRQPAAAPGRPAGLPCQPASQPAAEGLPAPAGHPPACSRPSLL